MQLNNIKISTRLFIGYALILILSFTTTVLSIVYINRIWTNTKTLYEHPFAVTNSARDIKIGILEIRQHMLEIPSIKNASEFDSIITYIAKDELFANDKYQVVYKQYLGKKEDIDKSHQLYLRYKEKRDKTLQLYKSGQINAAIFDIQNDNAIYVNELLASLDVFIVFASNTANRLYSNAQETKNKSIVVIWIVLSMSVFMSIFFAIVITRSIVRPLKVVVRNIAAITDGNLNNTELIETRDEIGQMSQSFNAMQKNLLQKASIADMIAQGDFSKTIELKNPNDILGTSINMISSNFRQVVELSRMVSKGNFKVQMSNIANTNQLSIVISEMLESLREVVDNARRISEGDFTGEVKAKSESDELAIALNQMNKSLYAMSIETQRQNKIKIAQNELYDKMRGDIEMDQLTKNIVSHIAKFANAQIAAIYLKNNDYMQYQLSASYAFTSRKGVVNLFKEGEGLIGQVALEKEIITFSEIPDDYIKITSGLGNISPRTIIGAPFVCNGKVLGVIELGSSQDFHPDVYEFLNSVIENIAIALLSAHNRTEMSKLLIRTKELAEELQVQQEELRQTNEELEEQTKSLRKSEEFLQTQQEELRVTNEELEDKTRNLERQKEQIEKQNQSLETVQADIQQKAHELEVTNKYKSEFLANMSHELRTPLNSLLILSQSLVENKKQNLTTDQIESAQIIFNSGNDLLNLINDILDLSKIESGKMKLSFEKVPISEITFNVQTTFQHLLKQKNLQYKLSVDEQMPKEIVSDYQRLNQVIRNLMSNAIKFTENGSVDFTIFKPNKNVSFSRKELQSNDVFALSVKDSGIGIAKEKQLEIFEAFQQAEGGISRKYGGTGLGLSITRELVRLLGGEIKINSELGVGSEFIIYLPIDSSLVQTENEIVRQDKKVVANATTIPSNDSNTLKLTSEQIKNIPSVLDDRDSIQKDEKVILIVEDELNFASILVEMCHQKHFKCLATATGEEAIELATKFQPHGIILDINLPGMDGWQVLNELKNNSETRHVPVHIMSGHEETIDAFNKGAIGYLTKPATKDTLENAFQNLQSYISKKIKDLLIIEDDDNLRQSIRILLNAGDLKITDARSGAEAIKIIKLNDFDCAVLDLGLPDMTGFEMLKQLRDEKVKIPPIVVYTGKDLTPDENTELQKYTQNIIIKGVKSNERLLDETALFLHRVVDKMPDKQKRMLTNLYDKDKLFFDKKILVVDDDMRNVFALTKVLEEANIKVTMAPNGQKALEQLNNNPDIDLVLMDIMMPVMDGYETMQHIRLDKRFKKLPIIALTAKAMKEDREKSIAAGANDYLSKPLDVQKLFNLMRIWLYQ